MRRISTTSKDVVLSSDPNADVEIDAKASSFCITTTDIEHDLQDQDAITPDPATSCFPDHARRSMYCYLCIIAMCVLLFMGVGIKCSTSEYEFCTSEESVLLVVLWFVFMALLICLPFYQKDPTQTIREFSIVVGMWAAAIAGSFVGIYSYILLLGIGKPWALVFGVSSSLLTCFIVACRRKRLFIENMLHRFYLTQIAVALIIPMLHMFYDMQLIVALMVAPIPIGVFFFITEEGQETVRTAELDLFIVSVFWQFLYLTTSTMTWVSLVGLGLGYDNAPLATIIVWPFLLYQIYKKSASFVDWLIATHGQQHLIRMLVPNYEIINDTEDKKVVGEPGAALELI